jgi:hypothetical protein
VKCNRFLIIFHSTVSESNKKVDFARWNPIIHSKPVRNQIFMLNHRFLLACNQFIILLLIYYLLSFTYICILYKKYISIIIVSSKQKSASETSFFGTLKNSDVYISLIADKLMVCKWCIDNSYTQIYYKINY